jgi:RecJ-like exonuclease
MESERNESSKEPVVSHDQAAIDAGECPACHGAGRVVLLVSATPCEACGGTGKIGPQAEEPTVAEARDGVWVTTTTYDAGDRVVLQVQTFVLDPSGGVGCRA